MVPGSLLFSSEASAPSVHQFCEFRSRRAVCVGDHLLTTRQSTIDAPQALAVKSARLVEYNYLAIAGGISLTRNPLIFPKLL